MSTLEDLRTLSADMAQAIEAFKVECSTRTWPVDPLRAQDSTGRPILAEQFAALGQVLAAIANLEASRAGTGPTVT